MVAELGGLQRGGEAEAGVLVVVGAGQLRPVCEQLRHGGPAPRARVAVLQLAELSPHLGQHAQGARQVLTEREVRRLFAILITDKIDMYLVK